jgi:hypothetical protein
MGARHYTAESKAKGSERRKVAALIFAGWAPGVRLKDLHMKVSRRQRRQARINQSRWSAIRAQQGEQEEAQ